MKNTDADFALDMLRAAEGHGVTNAMAEWIFRISGRSSRGANSRLVTLRSRGFAIKVGKVYYITPEGARRKKHVSRLDGVLRKHQQPTLL